MVVQRDELAERLNKLSAFESLEGRDYFTNWSKALEREAKTAWNSRLGSRYRRVKVLLVEWVSDDLTVNPKVDWLRQISEYAYEYEVSRFSIPDSQPSIALSVGLARFMGDHNPDTLLIFYYSGHGMIDPARNLSYGLRRFPIDHDGCTITDLQQKHHRRLTLDANRIRPDSSRRISIRCTAFIRFLLLCGYGDDKDIRTWYHRTDCSLWF